MNCQLLQLHPVTKEDLSFSSSLRNVSSISSPTDEKLVVSSSVTYCYGNNAGSGRPLLRHKSATRGPATFSIELRFSQNKGKDTLGSEIVARSTGSNESHVTGKDSQEEVTISLRKGDALHNLAQSFDCSVDDWVEANKESIIDPYLIYEGQDLKVPPNVCYRGTVPPEYADRVKVIPKTAQEASETSVFSSMLSKLHVKQASEIAKAKASSALDELQKKKSEFTASVFSSPVIGPLGLGGKSGLEAKGGNPYRAGLVIALGFALLTAALVSIWKKEQEVDTRTFTPTPPPPPPPTEPVYSPPIPVPDTPVTVSVSTQVYWESEVEVDKVAVYDSALEEEPVVDNQFHFEDQNELQNLNQDQSEKTESPELLVSELESEIVPQGDVAVLVSSDSDIQTISDENVDIEVEDEGHKLSEDFSTFVTENEIEDVSLREIEEDIPEVIPEVPVVIREREGDLEIFEEKEKSESPDDLIKTAIPLVAVSSGAFAFFTGGFQGGLELVGLTALTSFITFDLLWADERVKLWNEVKDIRSNEKFIEFLKKKKILPED